ncbi:MAG: putative manganese-dependent inorganic diphosphatase [Verrucomicrobiales bacterium]|jgi:manganese-dependent inorganic pyrophosphatase|nr:putative manganese-dependent inorganic diphosphatase [Verrucomicrobiales bacterium]
MPTYVIGHKNPDTDAICSAIGYAEFLKNTYHPDAVAACCGEPNARTLFALNEAKVEAPRLLLDVRPTAEYICHRHVISANESESLLQVFDRMREQGLRSMPVLNGNREMVGLLSFQKALGLLLPGNRTGDEARAVTTTLEHIRQVLGGHFLNAVNIDSEETLLMSVAAMSARSFEERLHDYPPEQLLIVVGNRPTAQKPAINYGARCIVVTGSYELDASLLALAREKKVTVISSPLDTASTTLLIKCAQQVSHVINRDCVRFSEHALVDEIREAVQAIHQDLFPVISDEGKLVGVFSKSDLVNPPRTKLILVDHNEFSQAVTGVEEAEILEVIDHHRLGGDLVTREPIRFTNDTVGSTSTLVARAFRQHNLQPEPGTALCLAAGIISDTLNLSSPTSTVVDRDILQWLGQLAKVSINQFAEKMFSVGSPLQTLSSADALNADCKEYMENGWKIAVSQVEELDFIHFESRKADLKKSLNELVAQEKLDFACLLVTDINTHNSLLLAVGNNQLLEAIDYPGLEPNLFELRGVVSRKKQLLPALIRILTHVTKR